MKEDSARGAGREAAGSGETMDAGRQRDNVETGGVKRKSQES